MATGIYRFHINCGRHGNLDGKFTATAEDIAFAVGHRLYFEEPWGKHSGVEVTLGDDAFTLVSADPAEVATFAKLNMGHGECPLGLLHDSISDGRIELTAEQASAAPPYFRSAIEANAKRLARWATIAAAEARPDLAAIDIHCSACNGTMRMREAGPRGATWTCDTCNAPA